MIDTMRQLPAFELVVFPEDPVLDDLDNDSDVRRTLSVDGVPREFLRGRYAAAVALRKIDVAGKGRLIRFGAMGLSSACVDPVGGEVFDVVAPDWLTFVNSSLGQFTETVRGVVDRFPFYGRSATDKVVERVGADLTEIIGNIDPRALVIDQFWSTFLDDVTLLRDFATEDVLQVGA